MLIASLFFDWVCKVLVPCLNQDFQDYQDLTRIRQEMNRKRFPIFRRIKYEKMPLILSILVQTSTRMQPDSEGILLILASLLG